MWLQYQSISNLAQDTRAALSRSLLQDHFVEAETRDWATCGGDSDSDSSLTR